MGGVLGFGSRGSALLGLCAFPFGTGGFPFEFAVVPRLVFAGCPFRIARETGGYVCAVSLLGWLC